MRMPFVVLDARDAARELGPHQWTVRLLLPAGAWLTLLSAEAAGGGAGWSGALVVTVLAGWAAVRPDSARPALLLLALLLLWWATVEAAVSGWVLGGALGVLLVHTAAAYASETPPGGGSSAASARRWLRDVAAVLALTSGLVGLAAALSRVDATGRVVWTGAALVGLLATVVVLAVRGAVRPAVSPSRER